MGTQGRFVLLEHCWNGVHWDLMLERDGALKTWALAEPPRPGETIEAGALPDHRLAYLDYEGPVSGDRGAVHRVDRGRYEALVWTEDHVEARLDGARVIGLVTLRRAPDRRDSASSPSASPADRRGWRFRWSASASDPRGTA